MRRRLILLLGLVVFAQPAWAGDVTASPPRALSVSVYRNPDRVRGSITLDNLGGFALVTETRTVHLPAGESRLRFEGVVDGVDPTSAIITGLPRGVIEKNRDAALLSPEALVRAAVGAKVALVRTNPKTGKTVRVPATIRSANGDGVVFETSQGVEALRCSGVPETFSFEREPAGLSAKPTLSVLARADHAITTTVTLSYLTDGFDWSADYVAHINPGGRTLNLTAWLTLANANSVSLPAAATRIIAGRLNRVAEDDAVADATADDGVDPNHTRIIANCWPQGTTSSLPPVQPRPPMEAPSPVMDMATEVGAVIVTAEKRSAKFGDIAPEQLGDLKLYRLPAATNFAAMQSKQVMFLKKTAIPFSRVAVVSLPAEGDDDFRPTLVLLRTRNTLTNHLGLPLPAGAVSVFDREGGRDLVVGKAGLKDTALKEDIEMAVGRAADVQVRQVTLTNTSSPPEMHRIAPDFSVQIDHGDTVVEVDITNARPAATAFELSLRPDEGTQVSHADHPMGTKNGLPIFYLTLPPNGSVAVRYAVHH